MAKRTHGYERESWVNTRYSPAEKKILIERAAQAGAASVSAYIRHRTIAGPETQLPPYELLRDLRNEVIKADIAKDYPEMIRALNRISQLK